MPTLKVAFLWAMQLFLDDSHLEVIGSGPQGPVVIDRHTHQEVTQSKVRAAEEHGGLELVPKLGRRMKWSWPMK